THTIFTKGQKRKFVRKQEIKNHKHGMHFAINMIIDPETGALDDISQIDAVGHRVVQGGEEFSTAVVIDNKVKNAIRDNFSLAPLHNPANLTGIEVSQELLPDALDIAVFDTQFHQTMPEKAFLYALPYEYYTKFKIRKYGFHGTSHKYVADKTAELMEKDNAKLNLITIHLGNGCSMCAIEKGKCKDTSMGMTPLSGIMMGTRAGDLDPAIPGFLVEQAGMDIKEVDKALNCQSGLKGISGLNDMRDIHEASEKGNDRAKLAIDMFAFQIKKYIGAYAAVLGSVDALVFTAGIGENDDIIRAKACENLAFMGIEIDLQKNSSKKIPPFSIHSKNSRLQVWVIPTNEEFEIAKQVLNIISQH
ncbi:MAG: acetate kinase, partial [Thermodesulfobacteriota bacterium]